MQFGIHTIDDFVVKDKTVLLRVDINEPVDKERGLLNDITRIAGCAPTVKELTEVGIECETIRVDDYTGKKMTFFHDPDGLPLELHE